jgi:F1F0 ATPase subunit 2
MSEVLAAIAGAILGGVFFGGLWWTVRRALPARNAGLWFSGSLLLRTAIAVAGFLFVGQGDWRRMAWCAAGFVVARVTIVRLTRIKDMA